MAPAAAPRFDEVFREHGRYVWRALRYLGVREADLDDVCQEVFVIVHRKLGAFEGRSSVRTWLYGIAVRVASDYRKSAYVRREQPSDAPQETATDGHHGADARRELVALLETLSEPRREVVVLYEIEGFTMPEVADALGIPLQTAYTRLRAARDQMQQLAQQWDRGGAP